MPATTVHAAPPEGEAFTPCCRKSPFYLPETDRMTLDPALVTCDAVGAPPNPTRRST